MKQIIVLIFIFNSFCIFSQSTKNKVYPSFEDFKKRTLTAKDISVKEFIKLFTEKYNPKSNFNFVVLSVDFPKNWVKPSDISYLLNIVNSNKKCCGYMNIFSSHISSDNAEIGGFALLFLKSYKTQTKLNLGLNSNPKANKKEAEEIKLWFSKNLK